jgi:hypothetical protein
MTKIDQLTELADKMNYDPHFACREEWIRWQVAAFTVLSAPSTSGDADRQIAPIDEL